MKLFDSWLFCLTFLSRGESLTVAIRRMPSEAIARRWATPAICRVASMVKKEWSCELEVVEERTGERRKRSRGLNTLGKVASTQAGAYHSAQRLQCGMESSANEVRRDSNGFPGQRRQLRNAVSDRIFQRIPLGFWFVHDAIVEVMPKGSTATWV